ncbi:MAG: outer membrane protein assembly factor BamD [Cyclobacteriaceae bacterium]
MTRGFYIFILSLFILAGCSEYNRVRKKGTFEEKIKLAIEYYDSEDYFKSSTLLEDLLAETRGRKEAIKVNYYYALTQHRQKQYIISGHHFKKIYETYPRSEYAEECKYLFAMSLYEMTPNFNLDQSNTNDAIYAFQDYINKYPETKRLTECNTKIDELRAKLEKKAFQNAKYFYQVHRYKASVISLDNFLKSFPGSRYSEEALYNKVLAQYHLATNSLTVVVKDGKVIQLKRNRLREVTYFYLDFIDKYPESRFGYDAEKLYSSTKNKLDNLNKINN